MHCLPAPSAPESCPAQPIAARECRGLSRGACPVGPLCNSSARQVFAQPLSRCSSPHLYSDRSVPDPKAASPDATSALSNKKSERLRALRCYRSRARSEEHTSELQSRGHLVCRLLL